MGEGSDGGKTREAPSSRILPDASVRCSIPITVLLRHWELASEVSWRAPEWDHLCSQTVCFGTILDAGCGIRDVAVETPRQSALE